MKRFFSALLVLAMMLSLAACGGSAAQTPAEAPAADAPMQYITPEDAKGLLEDAGYVFFDIRKAADSGTSTIPGALAYDMDAAKNGDLQAGQATMKKATEGLDKKIILVCYSGKRYAQAATNALSAIGYDMSKVYTLEGGFTAWSEKFPKLAVAPEASDAPAAEAVSYKTELNIAINANPPTLDAHAANTNIVGCIGSHIYEPLFAMNGDNVPTAVLAESYELNDDGTVYTIKIRQGIKFHNGQEMTADDVVPSMTNWLAKSTKATPLAGTTFEKVDDYTITMTLPAPYSGALDILAGNVQFAAIYPKSSLDNAGETGITEFIGTGPYKLAEWKQDQYVHLTKFDGYQQPAGASSGFTGEKTAATPDIYFRVVTDETTRIAGLQTGEYDIAEGISLEQYDALAADPNVAVYTKTGGTLNLFFNTTKGIMAKKEMRQAIMACLNCDDIMMASYVNPNLYSLNQGWMNPNSATWGSQNGEYYNQNNPAKAKELLAAAGYNNEEILLVTTPDYPEMYNATLVVQQQLIAAGINAKVEQFDFATFMQHRSDPEQFSLFITSNSYNILPVTLSVLNPSWAGLEAPEVAEYIAAIKSAASTEEAAAKWQELEGFLYEFGAASVLGHYSGVEATVAGVEGFDYFNFPIYWNVKVPA